MRRFLCSIVVAASFVSAGVTLRGDDGDDGNRWVYQTSQMFQFMTTTPVGGAATLMRSKNRLEMRVATSGLSPNSTFTVWWVIFNNPAACTGGCGIDDLPNPEVRASVFYAAGFVTGNVDGTGNVSGYVNAGALPEDIDIETGRGLRNGNGLRAEVHIVVRTHGMLNPGSVHEQIGTFNGGCNPTCSNVQAAGFLPVA